jgi:hypothetical protein
MSFTRIKFEDGKVYHGYHWNRMQENIAHEIKERDVIRFYDTMLITTDLNYSFTDPLTDTVKTDTGASSNMDFDDYELKYIADEGVTYCAYVSQEVTLPESTKEVKVNVNSEDIPDSATVDYKIIHDNGDVVIPEGETYMLYQSTSTLKLKVDIYNYDSSVTPPKIVNYCIMWK